MHLFLKKLCNYACLKVVHRSNCFDFIAEVGSYFCYVVKWSGSGTRALLRGLESVTLKNIFSRFFNLSSFSSSTCF